MFRLNMYAGETRVVFGAAGSGKTMLLKAAVGLVKPDSGPHLRLRRRRHRMQGIASCYEMRAGIGILFQEGGLFDSLTIAENVAYPLLNQQALRQQAATGRRPKP